MSRRLREALKGAVLLPMGAIAISIASLLPLMLIAIAIYAAFSLDPTNSVLVGVGAVLVVFLAAVGAWVGWRGADD